LEAAVREETRQGRTVEFRIGVADAVSKSIAQHLVEPALLVKEPVRIVCREWRLDRLLSELAAHALDLVIADAPVPPTVGALLAQEFGWQGVGCYLGPAMLAEEIQARLEVEQVGVIDAVEEQFYAISIERRITHPCVLAITRAARSELFQPTQRARRSRSAQARTAA